MADYQKVRQITATMSISSGDQTTNLTSTETPDYKTYYSEITLQERCELTVSLFTANGNAEVRCVYSDYDSFNTQTGWPSSPTNVGWSSTLPRSTIVLGKIVLEAGKYYFWYRNTLQSTGSYYNDAFTINFHTADVPLWTEVIEPTGTLPRPLTSVYSPDTPIHPTEEYKIYHYSTTFDKVGTCRFESLSNITNVQLTVTRGTYTLDGQTGRPSGNVETIGPTADQLTFTVAQTGTSYHFWIRHYAGSRLDDLNFRITPPGELWDKQRYQSELTINEYGYSWTVNSDGQLQLEKIIWYIPLKFNPVGDYRFWADSSRSYDVYLTSSTDIDSDGYPIDDLGHCFVPNGQPFRYSPRSPSRTYYLMFRSYSGAQETGTLNIYIDDYRAITRWLLDEETIADPLTQQYLTSQLFDTAYTVYKKTIRFSQSGTISFYSMPTTSPVNDVVYPLGWITYHTDNFDESNGAPEEDEIKAHDGGENRQFSITYNVSSTVTYDFWFRLPQGTDRGQGFIAIDIPGGGGPSGTWSYERDTSADREGQTVSFTESVTLISRPDVSSPAKGEYFRVRFGVTGKVEISIPDSPPAILYVQSNSINADRGFDSGTGAPYYAMAGSGSTSLTINVTNTNTYYFIWVRGATTTVSGTTTVTVKMIQWQVSTSYSPPNPIYVDWDPTPAALSEGTVYKIALRFAYSGEAKFFSDDGHTRLAWLTATAENGDITPSTGIPILPSGGSFLAKDDYEDGNFEFKYTVAAGTTYYFWIRSNNFSDTTTLSLHIDPPGSTDTTKGFWLYDGSKWAKVKVFICTSINPVVWTRVEHPCICTSINPSTIWLEGT